MKILLSVLAIIILNGCDSDFTPPRVGETIIADPKEYRIEEETDQFIKYTNTLKPFDTTGRYFITCDKQNRVLSVWREQP